MEVLTVQGVIDALEACQQPDGCEKCPLGPNGDAGEYSDDCQVVLYQHAAEVIREMKMKLDPGTAIRIATPAKVPRQMGKTPEFVMAMREKGFTVGYPTEDTL